jgi:plastocyanin
MKRIVFTVTGVMALAVAGASAGADPSAESAQAPTAKVSMGDNFFKPAKLRVKPKTKVTWTNNGSNPHTATANNNGFDTGNLSMGQSRSITFKALGKYSYFCEIHPTMRGTIKVCKKVNGRVVCRKGG